MSIFVTYVLILVGFIFCLFVYWRRLSDDYPEQNIFASGLGLVFAILFGSFLLAFIAPRFPSTRIFDPKGLWFWGGVLGLVFGLIYIKRKIPTLRIWEVFEAFIEGLLINGIFVLTFRAILLQQNYSSWIALVVILIFTLLFFSFRRNYKRFRWYKSGKVGLSGLLVAVIFFLVRSSAAIFLTGPMLFFGKDFGASLFIGRVDGIISSVFAFGIFVAIYNLSQNLD